MSQMDVFGNAAAQAAMACDRAYEGRPVTVPPMETQALLRERATTHGRFEHNGANGQRLRQVMRTAAGPGWEALTDVQREALDMIAGKISRILSGQGGFADHWDDIAGYAKLAAVANAMSVNGTEVMD